MPSSSFCISPTILLLGDSLTQTSFEGWGATLADRYQRRADILNRGMSGYNTRWYLKYSEGENGKQWIWGINNDDVVLVTIWFGANDAALANLDSKHVPLAEYRDNLRTLIDKTRTSYPQASILVVTPPPVHHPQRLQYQKDRYGKDKATGILERTFDHTRLYAQACQQVAKDTNVPCLDIFQAMANDCPNNGEGGYGDFGEYLSDGLHFSPRGHELVSQLLLKAIEQYFPNLAVHPDKTTGQPNNSGSQCPGITSHGPYHDEIDPIEWEKSFSSGDRLC